MRVMIFHPPDDRLAVRMGAEGERLDLFAQESARVVLRARAPLLDHDLPLGLDLLRIEEQVLHAIGFEVDDESTDAPPRC